MKLFDSNGLSDLIECVKRAGQAILEVYDGPRHGFGVETKQDKTPVTRADLESHQILTRGLAKLTQTGALSEVLAGVNAQQALIVSEEDPQNHESALEALKHGAAVFFVDPLDGTREFIERTGQFVINIGLTIGSKPVFGLIYAPVTDELLMGRLDLNSQRGVVLKMHARQPQAATCFETMLGPPLAALQKRVPRAKSVKVLLSAGHTASEREILEKLGAAADAQHEPLRPGFVPRFVPMGSALKFCRIADGTADLYLRRTPTYAWDTVAGQAIVEAAGGWVCALGSKQNETLRVASSGTLKNGGFAAFKNGFEPELAREILAGFEFEDQL